MEKRRIGKNYPHLPAFKFSKNVRNFRTKYGHRQEFHPFKPQTSVLSENLLAFRPCSLREKCRLLRNSWSAKRIDLLAAAMQLCSPRQKSGFNANKFRSRQTSMMRDARAVGSDGRQVRQSIVWL